MWSYYHNGWPSDLEDLTEPNYVGRRLDVGGFVLADSFDTLLRSLTVAYLEQAWLRVQLIMARYQLYPSDLSWGFVHPGETNLPRILQDRPLHSPSHWIGWTSKELDQLYLDPRWETLDEDLRKGHPALRCGVSWRSVKWRVAPENFTMALRLIEVLCTEEPSSWAPSTVLNGWTVGANPEQEMDLTEPWVKVGLAIMNDDQHELDSALSEAQSEYTQIGYRIVVRGYATYLHGDQSISVRLPLDVLDDD